MVVEGANQRFQIHTKYPLKTMVKEHGIHRGLFLYTDFQRRQDLEFDHAEYLSLHEGQALHLDTYRYIQEVPR